MDSEGRRRLSGCAFTFAKRRPPLFNLVCFHSQQSAEKYLKSYLALKKIHFPKTHDLILLKNLRASQDGDFEFCADVLYLSAGKPRAAVGTDIGDGVIVRYDHKRGKTLYERAA